MFQELEVGKRYDEFLGSDAVKFDIDDAGAKLIVLYTNPDPEEVKAFKQGAISVEIKDFPQYAVTMLMFHFTGEDWIDAPYASKLSVNCSDLTQFAPTEKSVSIAISLMMADGNTGELKVLRLFTMRKETYKKFYKCTIENSHTNFTIDEIYENTKKIYDKYSTQDLVRLSD